MIAPLAALLRLHELHIEGADINGRGAEINRLRQSMSDRLNERYEQLLSRHGHTAVAELERGICRGCFMRQPGQTVELEEDVYQCENCGRLLYDPDVAFELSVG